jgi:hypothetical protein
MPVPTKIEEKESIQPHESVVRLIWQDYFQPELAMPVQPGAFEPRKNETDGISVFRLACLNDVRDVLAVITEEKREKYAIAALPVAEITALGLTVKPAPIAKVPGHAVLLELNVVTCKADKARCKSMQKSLAVVASRSILHRPVQ